MDLEEWLGYLKPVWLTMFFFGTLTWLYVVAIQITRPEWLPATLTHYKVPPFNWHVDDVGILSFGIAAFGFFVWRLQKTVRGKEPGVCLILREGSASLLKILVMYWGIETRVR